MDRNSINVDEIWFFMYELWYVVNESRKNLKKSKIGSESH